MKTIAYLLFVLSPLSFPFIASYIMDRQAKRADERWGKGNWMWK